MAALFIGLMSGTSLDGVDAVLADFDTRPGEAPSVLAHQHLPFDRALRDELLDLNRSGPDELHRAALAANRLSGLYAQCVAALLAGSGHSRTQIRALGAHGQTVRHRPQEFDGVGYTLQLLNGALLAECTGIDVVCDFRTRDLAAGGQGAPLVPAFHAALFSDGAEARAVLNIGGIANLTLLPCSGPITGFDCGPGNVLMDLWCQRHRGQAFDLDGAWAGTGRVIEPLLTQLLAEPFFARPAPKSTGRDLFHAAWLDAQLARWPQTATTPPEDIQATLTELTARVAAVHLHHHLPEVQRLLVCGGGALNRQLMHALTSNAPRIQLATTDTLGLPALQVEATAFAWLASRFLSGQPGNCVSVTGAKGTRLLGALYPAG